MTDPDTSKTSGVVSSSRSSIALQTRRFFRPHDDLRPPHLRPSRRRQHLALRQCQSPHYQKGTKRIDAIRVRTIFTYCGDFATNYGSRRDHRNLTTYQHGRANLMSGGNAMTNWSSSSLLLNWAAEKRTLLEDEGGAHPELSPLAICFALHHSEARVGASCPQPRVLSCFDAALSSWRISLSEGH